MAFVFGCYLNMLFTTSPNTIRSGRGWRTTEGPTTPTPAGQGPPRRRRSPPAGPRKEVEEVAAATA